MVRFYERYDSELKTRVDDRGTLRVSHTETEKANRDAAAQKRERISVLRQQLQSLRQEAKNPELRQDREERRSNRSDRRELRQELTQTRNGMIQDQIEAGYHGGLARLNQLVGRE